MSKIKIQLDVVATNAQTAIEELDIEKLAKASGAITGDVSLSENLNVFGTVYANYFAGDGSELTGINASALANNTTGDFTIVYPHTQYVKKQTML